MSLLKTADMDEIALLLDELSTSTSKLEVSINKGELEETITSLFSPISYISST